MKIVMYTKKQCPNCVTAKSILESKGLKYETQDAEDFVVFKALLDSYPEARQMPQIFINDQRVGGIAGLQAALKQVGL